MVVLNRIYTRTGDDGSTALASGERRSKADARVEAYGTIDETNAAIGLARLGLDETAPRVDAMLARIQNDLFDLGADLARPPAADEGEVLRVTQAQVDRLEREIDELNADLSPLRSFVLPGGTPAAAALHIGRTVCRRAERLIVALRHGGDAVGEPALRYTNRLSDFLFVASRWVNDKGETDILWVPGRNR
ncbi:cob(I)yrinic acid a,c-diamide adenosyltransferase [Lichenihabitans sp. Uapishka_5]|uniref:cob(I)yrinic acid a,c-diamide adenosyltransferase n=1 Tax=Lichenihabitans sp. Uapishka_5 TaxID=3037302 RepID=UPI0029E7F386|nr:cob(I)yrinic acid a,c-diamide adenosyltransferase [Lichenihabitans sp. Uapishka_5]MDX7952090.1 cob(I)yrinic acid a,c-diamide adenosyltransferase [Lichenihabitans sp. Uapishka_5]